MVSPVRFAVGLLLISLFPSVGRADLNLTPEESEYELDGVKLHQLRFRDGERRVTYTPPKGWRHSGTELRLILQPPHGSGAEAVVSLTTLKEPETFDDATTKRLSEEVLSSVPSTAKHVTIVSAEKNPLLIERRETFLIVIKYDCYGNQYGHSVMFLDRGNKQVRFELTCPLSVFPELQKAFQGSHYSWQNL